MSRQDFCEFNLAPGVRAYFRYKREPNTTDWGSPNCHPILNLDSGFGPLQADWKVSSQKRGPRWHFPQEACEELYNPYPQKIHKNIPIGSWILEYPLLIGKYSTIIGLDKLVKCN
jgi:hypothetical protein